MKTPRHIVLLAMIASGLCAGAAEDAPEVLVEIGAKEVFLGESVDYQIRLQNIKTPITPDLAGFDTEFGVASTGDRSLNSHSITIINGRQWEQSVYGHLFGYRLTPKRAGELTIPAPSVTIDGQKLTGRAVKLRVIAPEKQDIALIEIVPSRTRVYPTQPFEIALRVHLKPLPNDNRRDPLAPLPDPPALEINWLKAPEGLSSGDENAWLQPLLTDSGGFSLNRLGTGGLMFSQLYRFGLSAGREKRVGLGGENIEYHVYELKRTFVPQKSGAYVFGPATLKGQFVDGMATPRRYNVKKLVLVAQPKTVEVRDVPAPRPPEFCGGIGQHTLAASAAPTRLRVGDPFTLTLEIQRNKDAGSLDLLSAPDLSKNAKLAGEFEIIDAAPTGTIQGDVKKFAYGLRAKKPGVSLPALAVSFFNPDTEQFVELQTKLIALSVVEVSKLNSGELIGVPLATRPRDIQSYEQGIFQNVTDVSELRDERVGPLPYALGAGAAWVAYACLGLVVTRRRRRASDAAWQRRQRAQRDAAARLQEARAAFDAGRAEEGLRLVRAAVAGLVADMLNLPAMGMTAHDVAAALKDAAVAENSRAATLALLENIEAMEYGTSSTHDGKQLVEKAGDVLADVYRQLDAKR